MISLRTPTAPHSLAAFAAMVPQPDFGIPAFHRCKHEIRALLVTNQHHQCAYCERPIEDEPGSFHLDHVKSQLHAPARRFDITNLVASCETKSTCGIHHESDSVPDDLHPYIAQDLHLAFYCSSLGELSSDVLPESAREFAFKKLNLNTPGLKTQRTIVITRLRQYTIALGTNAKKRLKKLSTRKTGFISLHFQELSRFGYTLP